MKLETLPGSNEDVCIVKVGGALTINNFFDFQDVARKSGSGKLIVDLAEVPYIDSAALGCLIGIHVSREKNGRKYALVNVNDRLRSLFTMSGVNGFLVTYPSLGEAEAALAAASR
jgi:anti-anti-sigma factor